MNYTHLTQNERYQIYVLRKAGHSQREIARLLNRHPSTISRELARNSGQRGYRPRQAQHLADARAANSRNAPRIAPAVWLEAKARLALQHPVDPLVVPAMPTSPDQPVILAKPPVREALRQLLQHDNDWLVSRVLARIGQCRPRQ